MVKYVDIGRPIQIKEFELGQAPMGWYRIDILKRKLEDFEFRRKFDEEELKLIEEVE